MNVRSMIMNGSRADSGKTFEYKVEVLSRSAFSDLKSIKLDAAFFAQLSHKLEVGPYETYKTIQQAIDAAVDFDEIQIRAGTYKENLDFKGKTLRIDGQWEFGNPPVLDASGGTAISVPFAAGLTGWEYPSIRGLKIQNASVGVRAHAMYM